jgi:cation transport protein ChaC
MWNPGFAFAEARRAKLIGYHRAFCIYSIHYRGTQKQPGLVLGLDRGGVCDGIAFRVAPEVRDATLAYLRKRELIYGVYREALVPVDLAHAGDEDAPRTVWALTYIAERAHPAYAGCLPLAREASLIRRSAGRGGTNLDYFFGGVSVPTSALTRSWAARHIAGPRSVRDNRFGYRAKRG